MDQNQPGKRLFQKLIEPCFRDFEAELIIERVSGGGEDAFGLSEKAEEPAFVDEAFMFGANARTIDFEN